MAISAFCLANGRYIDPWYSIFKDETSTQNKAI
jgi:hypothetical protein